MGRAPKRKKAMLQGIILPEHSLATSNLDDAKDANNFYKQLTDKIDGCAGVTKNNKKREYKGNCDKNKCKYFCDKENEDSCEGKKIGLYLKAVVPEWEGMGKSRLYKHIQKMLENAESIRKFEIELIWKRAIYLIPILIIFFTALGASYNQYTRDASNLDLAEEKLSEVIDNVEEVGIKFYKKELPKREKYYKEALLKMAWNLLFTIYFISLFISLLFFLLASMASESRKWQENWENHVDYLQGVLSLNLMRTCLRPQAGIFTIGKINTFILSSFGMIFLIISDISVSAGLIYLLSISEIESVIIKIIIVVFLPIIFTLLLLIMALKSYKFVTDESIFKIRKNVKGRGNMYQRYLSDLDFHFLDEPQNKENHKK